MKLIVLICLSLVPWIAQAQVASIHVESNQLVTQKISMSPGLASIVEFPEEILSMAVADGKVVQCIQMPPHNNRLTCKSLVQERFTTNMMINTQSNEYNLIFEVDVYGSKHPFKYQFINESVAKALMNDQKKSDDQWMFDTHGIANIDVLLDDYSHQECSQKYKNKMASIKCLDRIQMGVEEYIRFEIQSDTSFPIQLIQCQVVMQTMGGLTGLVVKSEHHENVTYRLHQTTLHPGEKTQGILIVPRLSQQSNQRAVLLVQTNQGRDSDLILKDI